MCFGGKGRLHFVDESAKVDSAYYVGRLLSSLVDDCTRLLPSGYIFSPSLWNNLPASFRQPQAHSSSETNITHHPSLPLSSIPDLKRTCSTNPSHHRSSSYPPTAHWTSTGRPSRTSYHPALCFSSSVIFLLVDACV